VYSYHVSSGTNRTETSHTTTDDKNLRRWRFAGSSDLTYPNNGELFVCEKKSIVPVKNRPKLFAASITALYPAMLAIELRASKT
jgi:hypothetical protein